MVADVGKDEGPPDQFSAVVREPHEAAAKNRFANLDIDVFTVRGIALGVPDKPGIAYQILGAVADANIEVDVIIQNVSKDGRTDFSFTVNHGDYAKAMELLKTVVVPKLGALEVLGDTKICKVSIVGIGMRSHVGVAATMFRVLSEEGINIQMISTSEIKTSVVIDEKYMELAVRSLHKAFGLDTPPV